MAKRPLFIKINSRLIVASWAELITANNGKAGLKLARSIPPNLILVDTALSEMDGYEVCYRLKIYPKTVEIPIIFLSSSDDNEDKARAYQLGVSDYIAKPLKIDNFKHRINYHLK